MIKDHIRLYIQNYFSNAWGLITEFCPFSSWSCSTARTRGRGTSWRPSCIGSTESSSGWEPSSGSRSTTFSCGEWKMFKRPSCHAVMLRGVFRWRHQIFFTAPVAAWQWVIETGDTWCRFQQARWQNMGHPLWPSATENKNSATVVRLCLHIPRLHGEMEITRGGEWCMDH